MQESYFCMKSGQPSVAAVGECISRLDSVNSCMAAALKYWSYSTRRMNNISLPALCIFLCCSKFYFSSHLMVMRFVLNCVCCDLVLMRNPDLSPHSPKKRQNREVDGSFFFAFFSLSSAPAIDFHLDLPFNNPWAPQVVWNDIRFCMNSLREVWQYSIYKEEKIKIPAFTGGL